MESAIPKEADTIAVKRAARIAEKIREAKRGLFARRAWWSEKPLEILFLIFLFGLNFYLILPFFGNPAVDTPFSGPIIPMFAQGIVLISKIPLLYAVQIVDIIFFLIFPFSFYFLVKKLTDRKLAAILAVLVATLPTFLFAQTRLTAMFLDIDAHHIASLSITPIALFALMSFLKEGKPANFLTAAGVMALIALISPFGLMTCLIFSAVYVFSEMLLGTGRLKLFRFITVLLVAAGLSSFWYNPSFFFWMVTGPMGAEVRVTISKLFPMSFFILPIVLTFGYLLFDRKPNLQSVFLSAFCTLAFAIITVIGGGVVPASPSRYLPELGISLAFLIGVLVVKLIDLTKTANILAIFPPRVRSNLGNLLTGLVILSLTAGVVFGKNALIMAEANVLGISSEIQKGDIWLARDNFKGVHSFIGLGITMLTLGGVIVTIKKNQKLEGPLLNS